MEIGKHIIKTYSRRKPITYYESRAMLVPSYDNPTQVRESRLNDKTLVVENFDDTFDRLATGLVVPTPENSLDENRVANRKDSDVFGVFKVPSQAQYKSNEKPKQKGKPKKKDLVSKATSVKRKKVDIDSDDSSLSDQEETHKQQGVSFVNKKSKDKGKRVVKRKKILSAAKVVDKVLASNNADENASNNIDNKAKASTETYDNFKKPKDSSDLIQKKLVQNFQASTPRVHRIQSKMDMQNISPVIMNTANQEMQVYLSKEEDQVENAEDDEHNASEHLNQNTECNQINSTNATDNFAKPREFSKVDLLKTSKHLRTSTPRVNKILKPVNFQHLSPIISNKEQRITANEKSLAIDTDAENNQNHEVESNVNDDALVVAEQVADYVKSPTKVSEIEHSVSNGSEEQLTQEETDTNQPNHKELIAPNMTNENNNQDKRANGNDTSESTVDDQDDLLISDKRVETNMTALLSENTPSFSHSPLMFDDSEYVQNEKGKSNVGSNINKVNAIQINFSQNYSKKFGNNEESVHLESNRTEQANSKNKNFNVSTVSSYYPDEWTNDYDSTYGYDQHKNNLERDTLINSKLREEENQNSMRVSVNKSAENVTEINEISNIDNTEIQSTENREHEKTEDTLCDEDNTTGNSKNESDEQQEYHNIPNIANEDNEDSKNVEEDNFQNTQNAIEELQSQCNNESTVEESSLQISQVIIEEKQSYHKDESGNEDNHDSTIIEEDSFQVSQVTIEEKKSHCKDTSASLIDQSDESFTLSDIADVDDQSPIFITRPSKRRKTEMSEIMIYENMETDQNVQSEEDLVDKSNHNIGQYSALEDTNSEILDTESIDNTSSVQPDQHEVIIKKFPEKEVQIVLSRINYEKYKSPILYRGKSIKRKSTKSISRKSKDTNNESISKKKKQEQANTSNSGRLTRRSVTEDKMRQLYIQYECKNFNICATKLEDQRVNLQLTKSLKRKSRENSIDEDNEIDSSLTNGGLSEFLSKLNDPMKVTMRRKTHKKFDGHLAAINEDQAGQNLTNTVGKEIVIWGNDKRVTFNEIEENSEDTEDNDHISQPIFLKPGKSWARSLSIINHFHNGKNLDELAAGRENWRHSVQTVLNMQPEVSARGHSQVHEETQRESRASRASVQRKSKSMRKSSIAINSRSSMRIIPGGKRSTLTYDLMDSQRISFVSDRSRASRKTSLKIRRDTLIETEDDLIRSAKDIILKRCKQTSYEQFDVCFPDSYINNCRKIGEGVYGEVFLYESGSEKSVIKIIPIEGDQLVNCEPQKKFHEILSEIIIAEELHKLRLDGEFHTNGFVEVNRIMCVIGKYPEKLIDLWYSYDEQKKSENDCPSMFEEDQLYIILELAHGGQDLEAYTFQNASESYAIFLQTALTLAVAEKSLEFEHRDLHWGNLLISKTKDKHSIFKLGSEEISLPTKGVKVAVIDFTLSRMSYQGCKIFNDLAADPTLFEAQGEYQFDIYRMMRDNVNDDWQQFNPFTNVLWMDYTLDKMITAVRYKKKTTKIHKTAIEDMKALRKEIMKYSSAFDFVTNCKKVQASFDST